MMYYYVLKMTCENRVRYITTNNKGRKTLSKSTLYSSYEMANRKLQKCIAHEWYGKNATFEIKCVHIVEVDENANNSR